MKRARESAARWVKGLKHEPWKRLGLAISVLVTLAALAVFAFTGLGGRTPAEFAFVQNVELRSLDARFLLRGARRPDSRIVIVGIDEKTLRKVGSYPIARSAYARAVDRLSAAGARVIAFDITFPTPEKNSAVEALKTLETAVQGEAPEAVIEKIRRIESGSDNDALLAESMKRAGNVILGHIFLDKERAQGTDARAAEDYYNVLWGQPFPQILKVKQGGRDFDMNAAWARVGQVRYGIEPNIRLLAEAAKSYGFFNNDPDPDGAFRHASLLVRYQDQDYFPALAFQAVREYEQIPDQEIVGYLSENGLESIRFGRHTLRTERDGTALINYAGPYKTYPHYSLADVLDGSVPAATFRDKIVLVGGTALGIGDMRVTPFQSQQDVFMGVEINANIVDNLLHTGERGRTFLHRGFSEEMIDVLLILLFGLVLGAVFGRARPLLAAFSAVAALLAFGALVYASFVGWGMWLSFVVPASTLVANYAAVTSFRMIFEEREKRQIRKSFSQYVSPGVIRLIEEDPKRYFFPGGELKELSIMFADIRSFTSISEGMKPDELVFLLNEYLSEMTDILFRRWGTLDKYIGDAIMAFWGSPFPQDDHAIRACSCALDMQARLGELNDKWEQEGRKQLAVGIGINTGLVNVGNMGSTRRLSWTVMGDNVNLTSRLEGLTKEYQAGIIISDRTRKQVEGQFVCRELDQIRVKGKQQPVAIYELLAFTKEASSYADLLAQFEAALAAYRQQHWDEAIQGFEALLSRYPDDGPSHVLLKRSHEFRREAPAKDWDGVYVMKTK